MTVRLLRGLARSLAPALLLALAACSGDDDGSSADDAVTVPAPLTIAASTTTLLDVGGAARRCLEESGAFAAASVSPDAVQDALEAMDACGDAALVFDGNGIADPSRVVKEWLVELRTARVRAMDSGQVTDLSASYAELREALEGLSG